MSEESFVYTACPGWGDHDYCAIKTIVQNGKITRTEKVAYSEPEYADGHICQKGLLAARQPYSPERLTVPLKRLGERGAGQWQEISWDQALDEISAKLLQIREQYGAASVVFWTLAAGVPPSSGLGTLLANRFAALWGVTDPIISIGLDNGPFYSNYYNFGGNGMLQALIDPQNYIGADLIIVWGCNPIENQIRCAQNLVRAREAGARVVDVGLIFDGTAGFADEFIGVVPGTDTYLALAIANLMIEQDAIDIDFLTQHSVACYLVDTASGLFARDAAENYLVWDLATAQAVPVAPAGGPINAASPALTGSYTQGAKTLKTAFQMLKEHLAEYTVAKTAEITGVEAAVIERLAASYAQAANTYIVSAYGMRYTNSGEAYRALHLLGTLKGAYGRPGSGVQAGGQLCSYPIVLNDTAISMPEGAEGRRPVGMRMGDWFAKASAPNSPYKAFFSPAGNPVHQQPHRERWLKILEQMELVVDFDIWMTDTGELADYVLPDCMPFERLDIINASQYNHIVLQEPAIEPPPGCKDAVYLWSELARRVGFGSFFDKTHEQWLDLRLQTDYPLIAALDPPLTYERLKAEKCVRVLAPEEPKFDPFMGLQFATPSGRIEFYSERLLPVGRALPLYVPCFENPVPEGNSQYPYQLFTGRQRFFMQSMFTEDPINIQLSGGAPATRVNPRDAAAIGIVDGDQVEVYNQRGHVVTNLEIDESVPPGTIHVWFGWRRRQFAEGTYSEMVTPIAGPGIIDEVADKWWNDWYQEFKTMWGSEDIMAFETGGWDAYWDCACNVRKFVAKDDESGKVA